MGQSPSPPPSFLLPFLRARKIIKSDLDIVFQTFMGNIDELMASRGEWREKEGGSWPASQAEREPDHFASEREKRKEDTLLS